MTIQRMQEVIADHHMILKRSGKGGREGQALFTGGVKQEDRVKGRESSAQE